MAAAAQRPACRIGFIGFEGLPQRNAGKCHDKKTLALRKIQPKPPPVGFLLSGAGWLHSVNLPTDCLKATENKKPRYRIDSGVSFTDLVPER
jgi:hypothetical protein